MTISKPSERPLPPRRRAARAAAAMAMLTALPAIAQDRKVPEPTTQDQAAQDASQGTGPLPAPNVAPDPVPICADRPTKASVSCTVPLGNVQIESDIVNWTRTSIDGTRTDVVFYTNPTMKVGVGTHTDVEINVTPYETMRTRDAGGSVSTIGGVGDLYLRLKQRLTGDRARTQVSVIPYVKAPTARSGIGNGAWEGGAILAGNIPLPAHFTLTVGPEVDVLANQQGAGHHAGLVMLANLSHPVTGKINLYGELWTQQAFDPSGHTGQYSFDTAATYQLSRSLQLDAGCNIGLDRATPGIQAYLGVSFRI